MRESTKTRERDSTGNDRTVLNVAVERAKVRATVSSRDRFRFRSDIRAPVIVVPLRKHSRNREHRIESARGLVTRPPRGSRKRVTRERQTEAGEGGRGRDNGANGRVKMHSRWTMMSRRL